MSIYGFGIHGGFQAGNGTKNVWRNVSGNRVQGNSRAAGQENGAARRAGNSFADLAGSDRVCTEHLAEAVCYRGLDRTYWERW